MENENQDSYQNTGTNIFGQLIWRFVTSGIILAITAFFTPGFTIASIWALILASIVLTVIDYIITTFTGLHASSFGRGFVGFILAVITLYITQYFVVGYSISWIAAIIGALIYGVVDYFVPGKQSV